eukprot:4510390-Amphidinium_carterae.1
MNSGVHMTLEFMDAEPCKRSLGRSLAIMSTGTRSLASITISASRASCASFVLQEQTSRPCFQAPARLNSPPGRGLQ